MTYCNKLTKTAVHSNSQAANEGKMPFTGVHQADVG